MLMIDIKSEKVCFVEARSNVVEFLAGLLSLPLGTALDLLTKERMVGNIGNVLGSVEKLGRVCHPAMLPLPQQVLGTQSNNIIDTFYTCEGRNTRYSSGVSTNCGYLSVIPAETIGTLMAAAPPPTTPVPVGMYAVGDDMFVTSASFFATISPLGIKDLCALQEKTVKIGKEE
ncbi:hypothetical protein ZWY2020_032818, partial [Hordeum vulgare]